MLLVFLLVSLVALHQCILRLVGNLSENGCSGRLQVGRKPRWHELHQGNKQGDESVEMVGAFQFQDATTDIVLEVSVTQTVCTLAVGVVSNDIARQGTECGSQIHHRAIMASLIETLHQYGHFLLDQRSHIYDRSFGEETAQDAPAKPMMIMVDCRDHGQGRGKERNKVRILGSLSASRGIDMIMKIGISDVDFSRVDANNRT